MQTIIDINTKLTKHSRLQLFSENGENDFVKIESTFKIRWKLGEIIFNSFIEYTKPFTNKTQSEQKMMRYLKDKKPFYL